ncbi:MAG: topoisomerase, partial [Clostridia bacterium]|nr:topoisomerase [Clostridia bacterium]
MPYLTKEEIESARQPDLLTFLQRYDPGELIPVGGGAYKTKTH